MWKSETIQKIHDFYVHYCQSLNTQPHVCMRHVYSTVCLKTVVGNVTNPYFPDACNKSKHHKCL